MLVRAGRGSPNGDRKNEYSGKTPRKEEGWERVKAVLLLDRKYNQEMIVKCLIYMSFIKYRSGHRKAIYVTHKKCLISQSETMKERMCQTIQTGTPRSQETHFILGHKTCHLLSRSQLVFGVGVYLPALTFLPEPEETTSYKRPIKAASEMPCAHTLQSNPGCGMGTQLILGTLPLSEVRVTKHSTSEDQKR